MKNYVLALLLLLPAVLYGQSGPLGKVLIPYDDPVESGMTAAAKKFGFLYKPNTEGYWRFVELCEQKMADKGPEAFRGQGWVYYLASIVNNKLESEGINPLQPREPSNSELSQAIKRYPFLFNPTSDVYLNFYQFSTGPLTEYQTISEAILAYEAVLAVEREKRSQQSAITSGSSLAQFHAAREAAEAEASSRRSAANAQTGANAAQSRREAADIRKAAASRASTQQTVIVH